VHQPGKDTDQQILIWLIATHNVYAIGRQVNQGSAVVALATLLVHVDVDSTSDARVRLAAKLAERFGATLIGVSACILPPYPAESAYFVTREVIEQERRNIAACLKRTGDSFCATAGSIGPKFEWRSDIDFPETYVLAEARSADLLIVGRTPAQLDVCRSLDAGIAVLKAGRPVLVAPPGVDALKADRIVIAWKDTREARRALWDSLPLLHEAISVAVIEVCEEASEPQARRHVDDVARYLARHHIATTSATAIPAKGPVATTLIDLTASEKADLIVCGGYGHSRLGEWIFGGVTRELLMSCPICCLLSH
jgi:nucleotide-binding universal stress UspA family protein